MVGSTSVNPPFLGIGSHQVHLRDYYSEVNVIHILGDMNRIGFLGFVSLWHSTIRRFVTLFPTIEAFPYKLFLLGNHSFRSQLRALPFVVLL